MISYKYVFFAGYHLKMIVREYDILLEKKTRRNRVLYRFLPLFQSEASDVSSYYLGVKIQIYAGISLHLLWGHFKVSIQDLRVLKYTFSPVIQSKNMEQSLFQQSMNLDIFSQGKI